MTIHTPSEGLRQQTGLPDNIIQVNCIFDLSAVLLYSTNSYKMRKFNSSHPQ